MIFHYEQRTYSELHRILFEQDVFANSMDVESVETDKVLPMYTAVSCDLSAQSLLLSLPLRQFNIKEQKENVVAAQLGSCTLRSGEFVREPSLLREFRSIGACAPDAHAYAIAVEDVELLMGTPSGKISLLEPWSTSGVLSVSSFSSDCKMKVALTLEPIMLAMTETTLYNLFEVIEYLSRRWARVGHTKKRLHQISHSMALELALRFKSVVIRLLPYTQRQLSVTLRSLLESLERLVAVRGVDARVTHCLKVMLERRLEVLGLSSKQTEELIAETLHHVDQPHSTGERVPSVLGEAWEQVAAGRTQHILGIDLKGLFVEASVTHLSSAIILKSSEVLVTDSDLVPVLVIRGDKRSQNSHFTCSWTSHLNSRETPDKVNINAPLVELRITSDLQRTIDALHRALLPVQLKLEFLCALFSSCPSAERSDRTSLMHSSAVIVELNVLLIHKEQLLAEVSLQALEIMATGSEYELASSSVEVVDLSDMGALHPTAVWAGESGCSLRFKAPENGNLSVNLKGLRFCYLSRFVQELMLFYELAVLRSMHAFESYWQEVAIAREVPIVNAEYTSYDQDSDNDSYDSDEADLLMSCSHVTYTPMADMAQVHQRQVPELPSKQFPCDMSLSDAVFYLPRNSSSRDTIAVTVESAYYKGYEVSESWPTPEKFEESDGDAHRSFDARSNQWKFHDQPSTSDASKPPSGRFVRNEYGVSGCQLFACISSPLQNRSVVEVRSDELKVFLEVREASPVYCVLSRRGRDTSKERWRRVSEEAFNVLLVWDDSDALSRILVADAALKSNLRLTVSLAEYCLLLSIYYGTPFHFMVLTHPSPP